MAAPTTNESPGASFIETAPLVVFGLAVAAKMFWFALTLPSLDWWSGQGFWTSGQWLALHPQLFPSVVGSVLLLCALLALLPRSPRLVASVLVNLALTTLILADVLHFGYYGDLLSVASYSNSTTVSAALPVLQDLLEPGHALLYLDIVLGVLALPWLLRASRRAPRAPLAMRRLRFALPVGALLFVAPSALAAGRDANGPHAAINLQRDVAASTGILFYHAWDALASRSERRASSDPAYVAEVVCFLSRRESRQGVSPLHGSARGSNLIVLAVESLQTFVIDLEIDGQPIAPNLSRLARESLYFDNFHDQTHLGTTSDAGFMAFQSLHPVAVGTVVARYHDNAFYGLPAVLSERGYHTVAALAHTATFWFRDQTLPAYGFQETLFEDAFEPSPWYGLAMNDRDYLRQVPGILRKQPQPFMSYLLTASSHSPFELPAAERTLRLSALEGTLLGDYLQAIHYTDRAVGELMDSLTASGLLERSVLAVYGDHQAFLGATDDVMRTVGAPSAGELDRFRNIKHVPFMVRLPEAAEAGERSEVGGGHVDIAPTLMSLLGVDAKGEVMLGQDLTAPGRPLTVFRDGSFTDGERYYLNRFGAAPSCFDARTGEEIDCRPLRARHAEGLERLHMSDMVLQGNMIPALRRWLRPSAPEQCPSTN